MSLDVTLYSSLAEEALGERLQLWLANDPQGQTLELGRVKPVPRWVDELFLDAGVDFAGTPRSRVSARVDKMSIKDDYDALRRLRNSLQSHDNDPAILILNGESVLE